MCGTNDVILSEVSNYYDQEYKNFVNTVNTKPRLAINKSSSQNNFLRTNHLENPWLRANHLENHWLRENQVIWENREPAEQFNQLISENPQVTHLENRFILNNHSINYNELHDIISKDDTPKIQINFSHFQHKISEACKMVGMPPSTFSKRWREATNGKDWPRKEIQKINDEINILLLNNNAPTNNNKIIEELRNKIEKLCVPVYIVVANAGRKR